jgi:tRNA(Ile)-lysidine synthase
VNRPSVHLGRVHVHAPAPAAFDLPWSGQPALGLPHGTLVCTPAASGAAALNAQRLAGADLRVRLRAGGERIQLAPNRPRRSLKAILHDAGMPAWDRLALPLVFRGETLVAVPGVGVAADWQPPEGAPGVAVVWHPAQV